MTTANPDIILASESQSRAAILRNIGLEFRTVPAHVDEDAVKKTMLAEGADHSRIAERLAALKAQHVSKSNSRALVIGADQILSLDGRLYNKPVNFEEAREQLGAFSGKVHHLISAITVVMDGKPLWQHVELSCLKMRVLSDDFIDAYLQGLGRGALKTVGCYQLEGTGPLLFEEIKGDFYAILGLPLLPLLKFLREREAIPS